MQRKGALTATALGDASQHIPSPSRPARSRTQLQPADAHFEPHQHAWVQLAYCDQGLIRVTAMEPQGHTSFIVPPSRAVWIPANTQHSVTMLENAHLRTVYLHASTTPAGWTPARAKTR
jgi:cupin superfamily acireductone dioxygenase involved in methionine salvage